MIEMTADGAAEKLRSLPRAVRGAGEVRRGTSILGDRSS